MCTALITTDDVANRSPMIEDNVEIVAKDTPQSSTNAGASSLLCQLVPSEFCAGQYYHAAILFLPAGRDEML